jgi:hypothetical protein
MKRNFLLIILVVSNVFTSFAQVIELDDLRSQNPKLTKSNMAFKPLPLESAQSEQLDVTGWGAPSYVISNTASGLASSYEHSYRVSYPLTVAGNKSGYSLVFYGPNDKIPYSVEVENGKTTFYIPFSLHDNFKTKFEQAITLRKKVMVNLKLEVSGYREASWKF